MPERITTFTEGDLTYEIRVFEEDGQVKAQITVLEGEMDVNAVYFSSAGYDGPSANLGGPLNMNGGGSQFEGERISWENAVAVSRPGLGREGRDKESFLSEGESLIVDLDGADSIDDVDLIGIRATSVNGGGSIKGVSRTEEGEDDNGHDNGDDDDDNGDNGGDDDGAPNKVFFQTDVLRDEDGNPILNDFGQEQPIGVSIFRETPEGGETTISVTLPAGMDPTPENFFAYFNELADDPDIDWPSSDDVIEILVYTTDEDGKETVTRFDPDVLDSAPVAQVYVEEDGEDENADEDDTLTG